MRSALALVLGSLLLAPAVSVAQAPPAADKVVLSVVVKDKKDVAVPDLKPEEVEVTENGSKRPVESVRFVKPGAPAGEGRAPAGSSPSCSAGWTPNSRSARSRRSRSC